MSYGWSDAAEAWLRERMVTAPVKRSAAWWEAVAAEWNAGKPLKEQHTGKAFGIRWSHLKASMVSPNDTNSDLTSCTSATSAPSSISATPPALVSPLSPKALSEQEMLDLFQVDTLRWEPNRLAHNIWEQGAKGPDGEMLTQPLCQTTLTLKRIDGAESLVALTDSLLKSLTAAAPTGSPFVVKVSKAEHMLELDAFDLHLGKVAWHEETGSGDYDLSIAAQDFRDAVDDSLTKASGFKLAKALFPVGNDLLHTDNLRSETTSGTRVDSDSRYHKMFEAAITEMRWGIERLKSVAPVVEVKGVVGNHDRLGGWSVVRVLQAIYENDKRVIIDNSPRTRKYLRFGKTLLGFVHGNEEKQSDLPLIMAQECPGDWAQSLFREWHVGHHHKHKKTKYVAGESFGGVVVRTLRSLSEVDAWHAQRGYIGGRRAIETFVYHLEEGEVGAFLSRHPQR